MVNGAANMVSGGKGKFSCLSIQVVFNLEQNLLLHLFSIVINEFDPIVIVRIVAGRNHDSAVKIPGTHHIGYAGSSRHMKKICICPGSCESRSQRVLKHIGGTAGVLSDYNFTTLVKT